MNKKLLALALAAAVALGGVVATQASAATIDVAAGDSIQTAIDAAQPGDTIQVAAGTFNGTINVTKPITLRGAQADVDARDRTSANETVIRSAYNGGFNIRHSDVTIDGFTIDGEGVDPYGRGIVLFAGADVSDLTVNNTIFTNNQTAIVTAGGASVDVTGLTVQQNRFADNNSANAPNAAAGIFIAGATGANLEILNNDFSDTGEGFTGSSNAISLSGVPSAPLTNIIVSGNTSVDDGSFLYVYDATQVQITNNTSDAQRGNGVLIGSNARAVDITGNTFTNSNNGVRFGGAQPASDVTISGNTITGMRTAGVNISAGAISDGIVVNQNTLTGNELGISNASDVAVDANNNWWGCPAGPGAEGCDATEGIVLASAWYTDSAMTATNLDVVTPEEVVPGVPNTSLAENVLGTLAAVASAIALVVAGSVIYRRRSTNV